MSAKRSTTARGLGWHHQQIRRRLLANHHDGTPCWWCGQPMYRDPTTNFDGQALAADHTVARAQGGTHADRLLHSTCNKSRQDGSRDHLRPALTGEQLGASPRAEDPRTMRWPW